MTPKRVILASMALGVLLPLAACGTAESTSSGFRKDYVVARSALEEGEYSQANRQYARLMSSAGPFLPRIQLEYAHSLLRAGNYAQAAQMAEAMSMASDGAGSAAALAVAATARHELGLEALAEGKTQAGKMHLEQAQASMAQVLATHPELDPLGSLAGRQASIAVRLRAL